MRSPSTRLWTVFGLVALTWPDAVVRGQTEPATTLPVAHKSVRLGSLTQHYRTIGNGPPLLLLHGLTNTWRVWAPHLDSLAAHHTLIVPDLRGHGDTTNPSSTLTSQQVADDMFGLLDALSLRRVQIIGYSFGGHVALRMSARSPDRVEAMVIIGGAHRLLGKSRENHETALRTSAPIQPGWWLDRVATWHPRGEAQIREVFVEGVRSALASDFAMSDTAIRAIAARTLIVQGDKDEWYSLDVPLDLFRRLANAQLWIIPNATHSAVFWQDIAPPGTDFGGGAQAAKVFPEVVNAFLSRTPR